MSVDTSRLASATAGRLAIGEAGEAAGAGVEEAAADQRDDDRGRGVDQRQRQADPERRVGADVGRQPEDPADQRRLRVVSKT